jgi:hypothetical protein
MNLETQLVGDEQSLTQTRTSVTLGARLKDNDAALQCAIWCGI